MKIAIDVVSESIKESMDFLGKAALEFERKVKKIPKEEIYREMNFLFQVVYASSRLLKRPSSYQILTEQ